MLDDAEAIQWGETDHDPYLSSYKKGRPSTPFYRVFQVCSIFAATFLSLWNSLDLDIWHPVTRENQLNLQHDTWEKDVFLKDTLQKCSTKRMKFICSKKVSGPESLSKQLKVDTFPRMTAAAKCHFKTRHYAYVPRSNKKLKELSWFWHNLKFTWGSWGYYLLRQSFLRSGFETQLPNMESPRRMRLRKAEEELRSAMMAASKTWPLDTKKGLETVAPSASARSLVF